MKSSAPPGISRRLEAVFADRLHVEVPAMDTDLMESGLLDSLQFVNLLAHIEREFGVAIPLTELDLDRVNTLAALADLVHELTAIPARHASLDDASASRQSAGR